MTSWTTFPYTPVFPPNNVHGHLSPTDGLLFTSCPSPGSMAVTNLDTPQFNLVRRLNSLLCYIRRAASITSLRLHSGPRVKVGGIQITDSSKSVVITPCSNQQSTTPDFIQIERPSIHPHPAATRHRILSHGIKAVRVESLPFLIERSSTVTVAISGYARLRNVCPLPISCGQLRTGSSVPSCLGIASLSITTTYVLIGRVQAYTR